MRRLKAFGMVESKYPDMFGPPSDADLELILQHMPTVIDKNELFVYPIRLSNNKLDRQGEILADSALEQLAVGMVGKPGIFNHKWDADNQHSRIYKTEIVTEDGQENELGDPYKCVVGFAYTVCTEKNKDLIENIKSGILKEVSTGYVPESETPVKLIGGKTATQVSNITDVLEWSFVAVPALPNAGVVKSSIKEEEEDMGFNAKDVVTKLKSVSGIDMNLLSGLEAFLTESEQSESDAVKSFKSKIKSLEKDLEAEGQRITKLKQFVLKSAIKDVLIGRTAVSKKAAEMAEDIVSKAVSLDDDGNPQGVDEAKTALKDYDFLFEDEEAESQKGEDDDVEEKEDDEEGVDEKDMEDDEDTKSKSVKSKGMKPASASTKSINFTHKSKSSASAPVAITAPKGMSFN